MPTEVEVSRGQPPEELNSRPCPIHGLMRIPRRRERLSWCWMAILSPRGSRTHSIIVYRRKISMLIRYLNVHICLVNAGCKKAGHKLNDRSLQDCLNHLIEDSFHASLSEKRILTQIIIFRAALCLFQHARRQVHHSNYFKVT